eukprot:Em0016g381a
MDVVSPSTARAVAQRLKHFIDVQRREEGFDLSGPQNPSGEFTSTSGGSYYYHTAQDKCLKYYMQQPLVKHHLEPLGIPYQTPSGYKQKAVVKHHLEPIEISIQTSPPEAVAGYKHKGGFHEPQNPAKVIDVLPMHKEPLNQLFTCPIHLLPTLSPKVHPISKTLPPLPTFETSCVTSAKGNKVQADSSVKHDIATSTKGMKDSETEVQTENITCTKDVDVQTENEVNILTRASHKKEHKKAKSEPKKRRTQSYSHHGPKQHEAEDNLSQRVTVNVTNSQTNINRSLEDMRIMYKGNDDPMIRLDSALDAKSSLENKRIQQSSYESDGDLRAPSEDKASTDDLKCVISAADLKALEEIPAGVKDQKSSNDQRNRLENDYNQAEFGESFSKDANKVQRFRSNFLNVWMFKPDFLKVQKFRPNYLIVQKFRPNFHKVQKFTPHFLKMWKFRLNFLKGRKFRPNFLKVKKCTPTFLKVQKFRPKFPEGTVVQTKFPESMEVHTTFPEDTEVQTKFLESVEVQTKFREGAEVQMKLPECPEVPTKFPEGAEVPTKFPEGTDVQTKLLEGAEVLTIQGTEDHTTFPEGAVVPSKFLESVEVQTKFPKAAEIQTKLPECPEVQTTFPEGAEVQTRLPDSIFLEGTEVQTTFSQGTEDHTTFSQGTEDHTTFPEDAVVQIKLPEGVEVQTKFPHGTEVQTKLPDSAEVQTKFFETAEVQNTHAQYQKECTANVNDQHKYVEAEALIDPTMESAIKAAGLLRDHKAIIALANGSHDEGNIHQSTVYQNKSDTVVEQDMSSDNIQKQISHSFVKPVTIQCDAKTYFTGCDESIDQNKSTENAGDKENSYDTGIDRKANEASLLESRADQETIPGAPEASERFPDNINDNSQSIKEFETSNAQKQYMQGGDMPVKVVADGTHMQQLKYIVDQDTTMQDLSKCTMDTNESQCSRTEQLSGNVVIHYSPDGTCEQAGTIDAQTTHSESAVCFEEHFDSGYDQRTNNARTEEPEKLPEIAQNQQVAFKRDGQLLESQIHYTIPTEQLNMNTDCVQEGDIVFKVGGDGTHQLECIEDHRVTAERMHDLAKCTLCTDNLNRPLGIKTEQASDSVVIAGSLDGACEQGIPTVSFCMTSLDVNLDQKCGIDGDQDLGGTQHEAKFTDDPVMSSEGKCDQMESTNNGIQQSCGSDFVQEEIASEDDGAKDHPDSACEQQKSIECNIMEPSHLELDQNIDIKALITEIKALAEHPNNANDQQWLNACKYKTTTDPNPDRKSDERIDDEVKHADEETMEVEAFNTSKPSIRMCYKSNEYLATNE